VATDRQRDRPPPRSACECGAVRYGFADAFLSAANCHCSRCRATTGTAFKAFAGIERDKLAITTGHGVLGPRD
jgi:hypothetical protein